jgi:hypothetical protein
MLPRSTRQVGAFIAQETPADYSDCGGNVFNVPLCVRTCANLRRTIAASRVRLPKVQQPSA